MGMIGKLIEGEKKKEKEEEEVWKLIRRHRASSQSPYKSSNEIYIMARERTSYPIHSSRPVFIVRSTPVYLLLSHVSLSRARRFI